MRRTGVGNIAPVWIGKVIATTLNLLEESSLVLVVKRRETAEPERHALAERYKIEDTGQTYRM